MNRKNTEKIKALFESMVLDGLTGGFQFNEEYADEVNKAIGKLFRYIAYLEEENKNLKEFADELQEMLPMYKPCESCNGYGITGEFAGNMHISFTCEECNGEGFKEVLEELKHEK